MSNRSSSKKKIYDLFENGKSRNNQFDLETDGYSKNDNKYIRHRLLAFDVRNKGNIMEQVASMSPLSIQRPRNTFLISNAIKKANKKEDFFNPGRKETFEKRKENAGNEDADDLNGFMRDFKYQVPNGIVRIRKDEKKDIKRRYLFQ